MIKIRKLWKNKMTKKYCRVFTNEAYYILIVRQNGTISPEKKIKYLTTKGALNFLQKNGFTPHPAPSQPKEVYLQKVRAKSLELGRVWFISILSLLNTNNVSKTLGITKKQFQSWLEDPQLASEIDYIKFKEIRKLITGR
jgi:hypothetical protein